MDFHPTVPASLIPLLILQITARSLIKITSRLLWSRLADDRALISTNQHIGIICDLTEGNDGSFSVSHLCSCPIYGKPSSCFSLRRSDFLLRSISPCNHSIRLPVEDFDSYRPLSYETCLLTTTIEAQDDRLALVHIPLDLYPFFLTPILQVLFHEVAPVDRSHVEVLKNGSKDDLKHAQPAFLNFSITPVECSIMCPRQLANKYFAPMVDKFVQDHASFQSRLSISQDDFIAMQVYGEGLEAGQRVLELTSPLAMAGMYGLP